MTKNSFQVVKVVFLALSLSFGLSFVYAWTAPTSAPPAGNVSAPINTSATAQTKAGWLKVLGGNGGDTASRIGVGNNWWVSENASDGTFAIHQNAVGDRVTVDTVGNVGVTGKFTFNGTDANTKMSLGLTGKNTTKRSDYTGDTNYWTGSMGWGNTYDWNSVFMQGNGFFDNWGTNLPGAPEAGYVHGQGFNVEHYNNGSTGYGWQMTSGNAAGSNNNWYLRGVWSAGFYPWKRIIVDDGYGNVGIGTASPQQKLSVAGVIESTTGGVRFPNGVTQTVAGGGGSYTLSGATCSYVNPRTTMCSCPFGYVANKKMDSCVWPVNGGGCGAWQYLYMCE